MGGDCVGGLVVVTCCTSGGGAVAVGCTEMFFESVVGLGVFVLGAPFATCEFE